jgi:hypothetical protein
MEKYLKMAVFRRYLAHFWHILCAFWAGFAADSGRIGVRGFPGIQVSDRMKWFYAGSERGLGSPRYIFYGDGQRPGAPGE